MDFPIFRILAILAGLLFVLHLVMNWRGRPRFGFRRSPDLLLTACLGDKAKATRLADYEKRRSPGISDVEARRRARERIGYDNRAS